ncbi:efflux RND transporter periplasmic adaptor subunit [Methylovorus menthalis]|uniref:efflux RND transporter periplasmic adaptor subunit n=1 Tax=Methylovorus menthalis TaxID=1002227 RepID=UPI001E56A228|nr:efflux RND transporter periplasmic adaptor subunit [Methylovorus menthalis]MCB4811908.1 efflux RND transporter periplasmic adaptor subunit [Methylovorus menthalis]
MSTSFKKIGLGLVLLAVAGGGYYFYDKSHQPKPDELYRFKEVTQGDVEQSVSANGTLNPVTLVNVGTQVSGRISKMYVDFNDKVEKGQVLLELDDALFSAQIAQSEGNVRNAQASLDLAKANEARIRSLFQQEYVSRQELDQAVQALKSAQANLYTIQAQLRRDQTNLGYSIIRSPVSGVVVDRAVDVGQTVAASLQTPTLITIAQDLSKMQINTSFAEADIGNIKEGQAAKFAVDAFPNRNFEGVVKQLRLNPTTTSNVVTYNVVISVDNPDQTLLPGMTAYVNIGVAKHDNVLLVPNAALRYKPKLDDDDPSNMPPDGAKAEGGKGPGERKHRGGPDGKKPRGDMAKGKVYVLNGDKPEAVNVLLGITDGKQTEIKSRHLKPGDKVIVGDLQGQNNPQQNTPGPKMRMF